MTAPELHPLPPATAEKVDEFRASLRGMERRQWWQWSSAISVMILLTLALASFAFPGLLSQAEEFYSFQLSQALRGLIGMVLLFNINAVYQQFQINRIQRQVTAQLDAMSKMGERTEEVYKLAALDPLTGLFNRRSGEQRLVDETSRAKRHGRPLTVVMLDLNSLKYINDKYGHSAGDDVLKGFAKCMSRATRGSDLAVRLGGDEFMILLPECKPGEVRHVLARLSGQTIELNGQQEEISFSAGWTDYIPGEQPDDLMKRADAALYVNKRAGKTQNLPKDLPAS